MQTSLPYNQYFFFFFFMSAVCQGVSRHDQQQQQQQQRSMISVFKLAVHKQKNKLQVSDTEGFLVVSLCYNSHFIQSWPQL